MSWAANRRAFIFVIVAVFLLAIAAVIGIAFFYKTPNCTDKVKNQDEVGVDCGGVCSTLCDSQVSPPVVRFARTITDEPGRTDVIAYIDNQNPHAVAPQAPYTVELYDSNNTLILRKTGTLDIPPASTVPLFIPGILSGDHSVAHLFLTFPSAVHWETYKGTRVLPKVSTPVAVGNDTAPRITATVENQSTAPIGDLPFIVVVFDESGSVIAASETVLPLLAPNQTSQVIFTWNVPFVGVPARIEVFPIVPL